MPLVWLLLAIIATFVFLPPDTVHVVMAIAGLIMMPFAFRSFHRDHLRAMSKIDAEIAECERQLAELGLERPRILK